MNVRETMTRKQKQELFTVKTSMTCSCGKVAPPGPMKVHTNSSGHSAEVNPA